MRCQRISARMKYVDWGVVDGVECEMMPCQIAIPDAKFGWAGKDCDRL